MTDHTAAREALASALDDECPDAFVYTRSDMRDVAALVEEQDAKIAALRDVLVTIKRPYGIFDIAASNEKDSKTLDAFLHTGRAIDEALTNAAATSAAHDVRIRAEAKAEYEGALSEAAFLLERIKEWEADGLDGDGDREWHGHVQPSISRLTTALRTMGGDDE